MKPEITVYASNSHNPFWHCGLRTTRVPSDHSSGSAFYPNPKALECVKCGIRAPWVLIYVPTDGMGSADFGWGEWIKPGQSPIPR